MLLSIGEFADDSPGFARQLPTIDGDKLNAQTKPKEISDAEPKNPYAEMSSSDRLFARSFTEKMVAAMKLKEAHERQSNPEPAPAAPGG